MTVEAVMVQQCGGVRRREIGVGPVKRPVLSERELEVVLSWLRHDSKGDAARELFVSAATVATHVARVRIKYAECGRPARSKTALLVRMIEDGHTTLSQW